jgi:hypothetical protein
MFLRNIRVEGHEQAIAACSFDCPLFLSATSGGKVPQCRDLCNRTITVVEDFITLPSEPIRIQGTRER